MADLSPSLEPDRSFSHARHKVRWADHHINSLKAEIEQFAQSIQQTGLMAIDPRRNATVLNNRQIPSSIPLTAGDAVFSLRSALDCCWMGLKRAISPHATKATFPRAGTLHELKATVKNASVEKFFKGSDRLILETIRPYKDGNEVLWFGGQVDNWHKHNMLVLNMAETHVTSMIVENALGGQTHFKNVSFVGYHPSGFAGDTSGNIYQEGDADLKTEIILVSIHPPDERPLLPFLTNLAEETHRAVELFASSFGKGTL